MIKTLVIMLFSAFLLYAQNPVVTDSRGKPLPPPMLEKISLEFSGASLKNALAHFSQVTGIYLNYNEKIIPVGHSVTIRAENKPAYQFLQQILENTDITFTVSQSDQIVLLQSSVTIVSTGSESYTISGFINDAESGEALAGANIYIQDIHAGCTSNVYGFYSFTLPTGYYSVFYNYMGFETKIIDIVLDQNIRQNVELKSRILSGDTIVVTADVEEDPVYSTDIGMIQLSPSELNNIPVLFGEQDILKTLHLLPGVSITREGESGFNVRGGNPDQNQVLLDEAPVYNAFHFFGFMSVFNSDAIKDVKLMKGLAPPKYGGSLSSVLDIKMNEGNYKEFRGQGGIGLIFSRLTLEGPIVKDKSSYIISGRRTYADVFTRLLGKNELRKSTLHFYDLNLKTNFRMSDKNRLFFSAYFGRDALGFDNIFTNSWGNQTATFRWNHIFNHKLFLNSSLIYSNFDYSVEVEPEEDSSDDGNVGLENNINALAVKEDFQYFSDTHNTFNFGLQYVLYRFLPGRVYAGGHSAFSLAAGHRKARDFAIYYSHEFQATTDLKLNYGLRYSRFAVERSADMYSFTDIEDVPDLGFRQQEDVLYGGLEPRFSANYQLDQRSALKMGYTRNYQNIHMLSNSNSGTPVDVWQPSSSRVQPQRADQFSIGYFRNLSINTYHLSVELFYKDMKNQVDFANGANIYTSTLFESDLIFGRGWAYGIEFLLRKKLGKLTGWVGYSYSKSERQFDQIDNGKPFPSKFDRTHDFSFVSVYNLNHRWTFGLNWTLFTGNAISIPYGKYEVDGKVIKSYSERNAFRMPIYHRLDLSVTYMTKGGNTWNFSLYNAYGRRNAYALLFSDNNAYVVKLSLFSFVPSISYNFTF
jgi:hypothetical protein